MKKVCKKYGNWSEGKNIDKRLVGGHENVPTRDIHLNLIDLDSQWDYILDYFIIFCK